MNVNRQCLNLPSHYFPIVFRFNQVSITCRVYIRNLINDPTFKQKALREGHSGTVRCATIWDTHPVSKCLFNPLTLLPIVLTCLGRQMTAATHVGDPQGVLGSQEPGCGLAAAIICQWDSKWKLSCFLPLFL